MIHAIENVSLIRVLVVSLIGFSLGALWYSPLLFVKPWLKEMKITPEMMEAQKKAGKGKHMLPVALLLTILSTFTLAALAQGIHTVSALKGAELGLFVGVGLVASRQAVNGLFECRSLKHFMITAGHDVVLCVIQGAILGVWR